jgi:hypothetical protein
MYMLSIYIYLAYTNNIQPQGVLIVKKKTLSSFLKNPNQFSELKPVYARVAPPQHSQRSHGVASAATAQPAKRRRQPATATA